MPITYTNRKGREYFLCRSVTKTGKPRYYFSREQKGELIEEIPEGYEITESVNGIVSLSKARPKLLMENEIAFVKSAIQKHPIAKKYRFGVKSKEVIVYEQVGPDLQELATEFETVLGYSGLLSNDVKSRLEDEQRLHAQYTPIMKFILNDDDKRLFNAQRMCYLGSVDDWIEIAYNKAIKELVNDLIPKLGTDEFFDLF